MADMPKASGYLGGHLLVAMPQMPDPRFARSVVYLCAHTADGAMGLIVNKLIDSLSFPDLLRQLGIETQHQTNAIRVHFGGPVEAARGFVLHSTDWGGHDTILVNPLCALSASVETLRAIAAGRGPSRWLMALGYAGWGPGQLDKEMRDHGWYAAKGGADILFDTPVNARWMATWRGEGIDPALLAPETGHA